VAGPAPREEGLRRAIRWPARRTPGNLPILYLVSPTWMAASEMPDRTPRPIAAIPIAVLFLSATRSAPLVVPAPVPVAALMINPAATGARAAHLVAPPAGGPATPKPRGVCFRARHTTWRSARHWAEGPAPSTTASAAPPGPDASRPPDRWTAQSTRSDALLLTIDRSATILLQSSANRKPRQGGPSGSASRHAGAAGAEAINTWVRDLRAGVRTLGASSGVQPDDLPGLTGARGGGERGQPFAGRSGGLASSGHRAASATGAAQLYRGLRRRSPGPLPSPGPPDPGGVLRAQPGPGGGRLRWRPRHDESTRAGRGGAGPEHRCRADRARSGARAAPDRPGRRIRGSGSAASHGGRPRSDVLRGEPPN
jgi:hypothetical protein